MASQPFMLVRAGTTIRLGQVLGRGGEGAVFSIEPAGTQVAKIYSAPPDAKKVSKLARMTHLATAPVQRISAWPTDLLKDSSGSVRGFLMPRITARRDIHELYSPKGRSESFPEADFRFLVHVAANIARAFAVMHSQGHVIGDVNHGNVLVGADGTVTLIDCDSFQVGTAAAAFTCDVGVPLFTPPELHGRPFRGLMRSRNHDAFGLAVLLFHLLYMGRHPFAGRYLGRGEMPIEQAIAEYRFAYGGDPNVTRMERPPGTVPLETMGIAVADLFRQAFLRHAVSSPRPDPANWVSALAALESSLRECERASWHYLPKHLSTCPWCDVESQTGARLFGQRIVSDSPAGVVNVAALWAAISAVSGPGPEPPLPSTRSVTPPSEERWDKTLRMWASGALGVAALAALSIPIASLVLVVAAFFVWPRVPAEKLAAADRAVSAARSDWESLLSRWKLEGTGDRFNTEKLGLEKARAQVDRLPEERRRKLAKLSAERETRQRQRYLDRFRIERAEIAGIKAGRVAMLESYGIETAADVDPRKILQIPGFGPALTEKLVRWRRAHEYNFRFNRNEPIDPRDIQAIDQDLQIGMNKLIQTLQAGASRLRRISQETEAARARLGPALERAWKALEAAEAARKSL